MRAGRSPSYFDLDLSGFRGRVKHIDGMQWIAATDSGRFLRSASLFEDVVKLIAERWSYGSQPRLHAVDFEGVSRELQRNTTPRYWQVLLKRSMLRSAEAIAQDCGACAIVTGEAVGQVSSQTLRNLATISQATPTTILRPLAGFNKDEIIQLANRELLHGFSPEERTALRSMLGRLHQE